MSKLSLKKIGQTVFMGGAYEDLTPENRRHILFINLVTIIGVVILVIMALKTWREGRLGLAYFDTGTGIALFAILVFLRISRNNHAAAWMILSAVSILYYYLLLTGGSDRTGALWLLTYPFIAIFLVGMTPGVIFAVVMFLAIIFYFLFTGTLNALLVSFLPGFTPETYSMDYSVRVFMSYLLATALAVFYEAVRTSTQNRFQDNVVKLEKTTQDLTQRRNETDSIMKNVKEGIFLLDPSYSFTNEYSRELETILEKGELTGQKFTDVIRSGIPEKIVSVLEDYLEMLFQPSDNPDLLREINPIDKVELNLPTPDGKFKTKHLVFQFAPLGENGGARQVLGTVRDVTSEVMLVKELEAQEDKTKREMQKLSQIINVDPALMNEFISDAEEELDNINALLKSEEEDYTLLLPHMYQSLHAVKGNALLLGLAELGHRLHSLESELNLYMARSKVEWQDLFNFTAGLGEIQKEIDEIKAVIEKLISFQSTMSLAGLEQKNLLLTTLRRLVDKMTRELEKEAVLVMQGFFSGAISPRYRKLIKEVLIQIIRNAVIHGLEPPAVRERTGKPRQGTISITCEKKESRMVIVVRDNGAGLDADAIRGRAKTLPAFVKMNVESLNDAQAMALIFQPGFSTARTTTLNAGRGVGLALVKNRIEENGGRLKVRTGKGKYTEFEISLPT